MTIWSQKRKEIGTTATDEVKITINPLPLAFLRGDANRDNDINIADPIYELDYQFAHKDAPPPPFPEAGLDPTEDELDCAE